MYPFTAPGIFISQPFGEFVVTTLPAKVLLDTAYSDRLTASQESDGSYRLSGSQRRLAEPRLKDIGKFIDTGAACFPNAIILAANYREEDGLEEEDEKLQWRFSANRNGSTGELTIPKSLKRAAIIDGQHRLFGFNFIENKERLEMPLVCAIFFELPKPYQARLFATINANQRPVSKSQTYELFGYNLEEEPAKKWTPEKLAVFVARKLNADEKSAFRDHIIVPAENDFSATLASAKMKNSWAVSMATVVEGTLRLITSNPKQDAYRMAGELRYEGHERSVLAPASDARRTPLRDLYRETNDEMILTALENYFAAVKKTLWDDSKDGSFILKTVGIQALFDISRPLLFDGVAERDLRITRFTKALEVAGRIDFSDPFFHASGSGRTTIKKILEFAMGQSDLVKSERYYDEYRRLLG